MQSIFEAQKKKALELRKMTVSDRKRKLKRILNWIYSNREKIAEAVFLDLGKPSTEAELSEIMPVTSEIKLALDNVHKWARPKKLATPLLMLGTKSKIYYEPKGTVLIIAPWNFPFNLTISPLVSAIAAGNTAIIKPSERTPHTSVLVQEMIKELFEPDEVTVVQGAVKETQELLAFPFDHIFFTGSPAIGKIIMAAAAKHLTSVTLELGGKSPGIIDDTANVKDAAKKLVWGKFTNCGQTCIAPDYLLVHRSQFEKLKNEMISYTQQYYNKEAAGIEQSEYYGRIVDEKHIGHLEGLLEDATNKGASVIMGGDREVKKNYFAPTILSDIDLEAEVMNHEIFGPILPIIKYDYLDEAIEIINSRPKPLALYLFTKSGKNQKKIIQETSSGGVNINDNLIQFSNLSIPFGGVNTSGIGKSHGHHGFLAFSNEKPIMKQRIGFTGISMFYPPYTDFVKKMVKLTVDRL